MISKTRYKPFYLSALLFIGAGVSSCDEEKISSYADAHAAFERHHFRDAHNHLASLINQGNVSNQTWLLQVKLMLELGDGFGAETAMEKLPKGLLSKAEQRPLTAHCHILQGRSDEAVALFKDIPPDEMSAPDYRMLIWAHDELGTSRENEHIIADALDKYPQDPNINALRAKLSLEQGAIDSAEEYAQGALEQGSKEYEPLVVNGRIQIARGDLKAARAYYAKASDIYPDHAVPLANMAGLDLDMGNVGSAEKILKHALSQHPKFPFLLFQKARLDYQKGRYEDVRRALQDLEGKFDSYAPALLLNGKVAVKLGNSQSAQIYFRRTLALEPNNEDAKLLLSRMQ